MREELALRDELDGHMYWIQGTGVAGFPSHSHEELELNLVRKGQAEYLIDGGKVRLQSGSLLWLFPSQAHSLSACSDDLQMWVYVFRPSLLEAACRSSPYLSLKEKETPERTSVQLYPKAFEDLTQLCERGRDAFSTDPDLFNASVRYLLLSAWRETLAHREISLESRSLHSGVFRAAILLCKEPGTGSLAELARRVGMSSEHLSRLFKQQMGQSLSSYRSDQRFRRFCELYGDGGTMNMLEASLAAGFGSYTQFYRAYRKKTGKSPSSQIAASKRS